MTSTGHVGDTLMPATATVTSKMQVTIPIRFARKFELKPGQKVGLRVRHGSIVVTPLRPRKEATSV